MMPYLINIGNTAIDLFHETFNEMQMRFIGEFTMEFGCKILASQLKSTNSQTKKWSVSKLAYIKFMYLSPSSASVYC